MVPNEYTGLNGLPRPDKVPDKVPGACKSKHYQVLNKRPAPLQQPVLTIDLDSMYLGATEVDFGTFMRSNHVVGCVGSTLERLWFFFDASWDSR